jgi:hypothetical protein
MKIYGYSLGEDGDDGLLSLREVSFLATSEELMELSAFFAKCAHEIRHQPGWDHAHLNDFLVRDCEVDSDVIVAAQPG